MIQAKIGAELVTLPEMRCYHRRWQLDSMGPAFIVQDSFGKVWAAIDHKAQPGEFHECEVPAMAKAPGEDWAYTGDEFQKVRMRVIRPANRHELTQALKKSPRKITLTKGHWYEVATD
jgi:hypothetical protein